VKFVNSFARREHLFEISATPVDVDSISYHTQLYSDKNIDINVRKNTPPLLHVTISSEMLSFNLLVDRHRDNGTEMKTHNAPAAGFAAYSLRRGHKICIKQSTQHITV